MSLYKRKTKKAVVQAEPGSRVYAIRMKDASYDTIKIGYTVNLADRLERFQTGNPFDLVVHLDMPGGRKEERALHVVFRDYREKGEWFMDRSCHHLRPVIKEAGQDPNLFHFLLELGSLPIPSIYALRTMMNCETRDEWLAWIIGNHKGYQQRTKGLRDFKKYLLAKTPVQDEMEDPYAEAALSMLG